MLHQLSGRVRAVNRQVEESDPRDHRDRSRSPLRHLRSAPRQPRLHRRPKRVLPFIDHVAEQGGSLCINGDGFDMLQTSFKRIVTSGVPVLDRPLHLITESGGGVHYVVGNHDLPLEHFMDSIFPFTMSPFLNLVSGDACRHPHRARARLRPVLREVPRPLRDGHPWCGRSGAVPERRRVPDVDLAGRSSRPGVGGSAAGDDVTAALVLPRRRRDAVRSEASTRCCSATPTTPSVAEMPSGTYFNSGNWLRGHTYIDIDQGKIDLKRWEG